MTSRTPTLLLIDDFSADRELYRQYLNADGSTYRLLEAETATAGLDLCQTEVIDAILLDYLLPDASGLSFLEALKAQSNGNAPPVVMVAGEEDARIAVQAVKLGAEDYLLKRYLTPEQLQIAMRSAIENARLRLQLQQQLERERMFNRMTQQIHQSLDVGQILNTAVGEVRQFVGADRAFIFRFNPDFSGVLLVESVAEGWLSALNAQVDDTYFMQTLGEDYRQGRVQVVEDIYTAGLTNCHIEMLVQFQVRANLVVPILQDQHLWGLLVLNQCSGSRQWQPSEVELLQQLATQIGVAVYQAELYQHLQAELIQRQKTEAQLRESQEWIQQLTDATPGFIYLYDLIEQRNLYTNQRITDVLGYTPEEIKEMGENVLPHLIHPDDFAQVPAHIAKFHSAKPGETFNLEYRMRRADGQWRWFLAREVVYRRTSEGLPWQILGIVQEITDRKRVEELLVESQQRLALSLESSQQGVWDYDVIADRAYWSPQCKQLFGLEPDHAPVSMNQFLNYVHPDDRDRVSAAIDALYQTNQDYDIEYRVVWSNGSIHWLHAKGKCLRDGQGNPRQNIGTVIDITDRKQLELTLKKSEQRFREIFNTTYQFIGLLTPDGILLEANQTALEFAGLSREAVVGRPFWEIRWWTISPETQQQLREAITRAAQGEFVRYEVEVLGMEDATTTIDFSLKPVRDESGQVVLLIPEGRDISDRLRYEGDRQRLEDSLRRSEERLSIAIEGAGMATWDMDLQTGRAVWSEGHFRMLGYEPIPTGEGTLEMWRSRVHPDDYDTVIQAREQARQTRSLYCLQYRIIRADTNEVRWIQVFGRYLYNEANEATRFVGIFFDTTERKQTELELEKFQFLVEQASDQVALFGAEGRIQYANRAFCEAVEYTLEELLSMQACDIAIDGSPENFQQYWQAAQQGNLTFETRHRTKLGRVFDVEVSITFFTFAGQSYLCEFARDITQRKQDEQRLRDSEERLRLGVQVAEVAIAHFDYATDQVTLSPEAATLYGFSANQLVVTRDQIHATFHPEEYDELMELIRQVLDPDGVGWFAREHRVVWSNGEIRWLNVRKQVFFDRKTARPAYAILAAIDITDEKAMEATLRESEAHMRYTVELNPQVPWTADPNGRITSFSDRWLELTGMTREHALGDGWAQAPHPDDLPAMVAAWTHSVETGASYDIEHRIKLAEGSYRWMRSRAFPRRNQQGEIVQWYGTTEDIDDRKEIEFEREELLKSEQSARAAAEDANRSKDEFISLVAHELRSPLNAIMGWAKLLQTREFDAATTKKALETIVRNTKAQSQLVEDLLDASRMVRGQLRLEFTSVSLADVVATAIETIRPIAEDKLLCLEAQLNSVSSIQGDSNRLQQVVLNLLTNAVKFTPEGGQIQVLLDQTIAQARIRITDTGKGISPDFLPYIFDRFRQDQQNSTAKQGLGLGLAIVQYIIEQHGGTISAHSDGEGQGATFTVLLPLLQVESTETELFIPPPYDPSQTLSGLRILLVDDDPDMLNLTALILEQSGAVVQTADSASAALERLTQFQPDILISDIAMPEQDGYELLRKVKTMDAVKAIPAIALTAFASEAYREDSLRAGFTYHLTKPVEPDELVSVILGVLQRRAV